MGMLNAMARQQSGFQSTGPAYPHYTQRMAETGQLNLGAIAQPQFGGASPFVSPAQQAFMSSGMDSGSALDAAMAMQMQADPFAGVRTAQHIQQLYPQKRPSNHLGKGL